MRNILAMLPRNNSDMTAYKALMESMSSMMSSKATPSGSMDKDFVQAMIPHHEGAVAMEG